MGVTVYSLIISVVFFNIALVAAFIMRRNSVFLAKRTVSFLLLTVLLGIVRLLVPLDFDRAFVVRSYHVIPAIEDFLRRPVAGSLSVASLLLWIWAVGSAAFLIRDFSRQLRFLRASRSYPSVERRDLIDLAGELGGSFGILVSPMISRPYVAGLFRPTVYLPDLELPEEQWRLILRHEVQHIRSHDGWKKLFFLVIQALFWWNPLAHMSLGEIDTLIELQCDAKATAGMSSKEVDCYLDTLMALKSHSPGNSIPLGASPIVWDQKQLVARFEALQDAGFSAKRRPHAIAYIVLFAAFVVSYLIIIQPAKFASVADCMADVDESSTAYMIPFTSETSIAYIVHENGKYSYYLDGNYISDIDEEKLSTEPFSSLPIVEGKK